MAKFLAVVRDLALLIARLVLGVVLVARGWHRWQVTGLQFQADHLRSTSTPYPEQLALAATIAEIAGGVFLIVGALTPVVAAVILIEQILIIVWTKWFRGLWLNGPYGDGWEYTIVTAVLCLLLLVYGGGSVAVDRLFRRSKSDHHDFDDYGPA